ncbi:MAG: MFS transporter [Gammaproteobacteria bacterium]|nr:MFS transporter [Gammaproteobacteria bacterium]
MPSMRIPLSEHLSQKPWYRWYALGVLTIVFANSHVDRQIMAILLEPIAQELGASDTQMGFLIGLTFAIFYATLGMPIAMLADRTNRRNVIAISTAFFSTMTILCGYAANFWQLALARIGVGIGEAGTSPPSHSLISDLFPVSLRATAMGIFGLGVNIGILIAFMGGGWMAENLGWRTAFVVVGVPGFLIAALVYWGTTEPKRGATDPVRAGPPPEAVPFKKVVGHMWRVLSIRHLVIGQSVSAFVGFGFVLWMPAFLMRSHDLSGVQVGFAMAILVGIVGGLGSLTSGWLSDRLAQRDERWRIWIAAIAKVIYIPILAMVFIVEQAWLAVALYIIPSFLSNFPMAPTFALMQSLVKPRMRALAAAILLFSINMIGMGLGPQLVGILSDLFRAEYGRDSLRMALLCLTFVNLWCGYHFYKAGTTLREDQAALFKEEQEDADQREAAYRAKATS